MSVCYSHPGTWGIIPTLSLPSCILRLAVWLFGTCYITSAPTEGVTRFLLRAATLDLALSTGQSNMEPYALPGPGSVPGLCFVFLYTQKNCLVCLGFVLGLFFFFK